MIGSRDIGRIEGFCLGVEYERVMSHLSAKIEEFGDTMAELDAHYERLLREIKEIRKGLERDED